jgi:cysteine desulfuration protein SufE
MSMGSTGQSVSARIDRLAAEFAELDIRERLELLLEFAGRLPPLAEKYRLQRDSGLNRVHECQTPVFLWVELDEQRRVSLYADAAPEAPTVKGFVSLLGEAIQGAPATEVLAIDPNLVGRLGLVQALGMVRMRGLNGILFALRRLAQAALDAAQRS